MKSVVWMLLLCMAAAKVSAYHILGVFPVPSRSHNHLAKGIVDSLLKAGHQVTWVTPYPYDNKNKNLKLVPVGTKVIADALDMTNLNNINQGVNVAKEFARNITTMTANTPAVREAVVKTQYDAVVTEWFFSEIDAGYAAVQQAPWILLGGTVYNSFLERLVDEVRSVPTVPFLMNSAPIPMNLWQRLVNTFFHCMITITDWLEYLSTCERYNAYFSSLAAARGVPLPPLSEATNNVSILLVNSHPSFAPAQPVPPNVINVAGYHIPEDIPPLPKDLQDLLDSSKHGVVYFSMGSVLKSAALPEHIRRGLIQVLGELPYTVLWKFEEEISGLPKNVHVRPWMPQPSILAHSNVKLFITHGGLLSTLESLQYGIPLLAIPMFGDQPGNAERAIRNGYARKIKYGDDVADQLRVELKEMLNNDRYYKRAKYLSRLFRNRPVPPSKLISHYVELAIETKGAHHLRSPSRQYAWYARWMLDQAALLLVALYLVYRLARALLSLCCGKNKQKIKRN
ncbi:UDP-glucosyltransferase 2-like [Galleria mellonella]|uniref:UDP-glucuronosyltransferase n=1 Tax=Galleria mellonella TaxID=7137 RepID=A0ABM3MSC9_GALME|nr:UDP-glucosyltransferase 2-like [Galleria mellonella]